MGLLFFLTILELFVKMKDKEGDFMQSIEEKNAQGRVVVKTCFATDIIYLIFHIFYAIIFLIARLDIMSYINLGSIAIYILLFFLLKKGKFVWYAYICGLEFIIFNILATIFTGFNTGFHFLIIAICIVSFFSTYFSRLTRDVSKAVKWTGFSLAIYLGLFFYSVFNNPYYTLDKWVFITLFTFHATLLFLFIGIYLLIFMKYAIRLEKKIINESRTDNLTRLPNRYEMFNYLDSINDKNGYSLAMFDIDDFKQINDSYGHLCGDYILKELALISKNSSKDSFVARYGGEEFIVIFKVENDDKKAFDLVDEIRKAVEGYSFKYEDKKIYITISAGIEIYSNNISINQWIENADEKLYKAKKSGKNKTII